MKISVWWLLAVPVLIAGIASSQAGSNIIWDYELKRPEAQKAISEYIRSRCYTIPAPFVAADAAVTGKDLNHLQLYCSWDNPAK